HLQHIEEVLSRFQSSGLKLNLPKCHFAQDHVVFLGHVVSQHGIRPDPSVKEWPIPRTPTEVQAFLGLCSYYRKFIKNFAHCTVPLHQLTKKNVPFVWTPACHEAFCYLQDVLSQAPVVKFPDFTNFFLYTDASCTAIGIILAQVQDNLECAIVYASHVLTKAERKWSTYDRELWAIVWAVWHFRHYLYKQPFTTVTDHKPRLKKIPIDNDRTGHHTRWALELDPYDWVVVHRESQNHLNADALSHRPSEITITTEQPHAPNHSSTDIPDSADNTSPTVLREWKTVASRRPLHWHMKGKDPALKKLWQEYHRLTLKDGLPYCKVYHKASKEPIYQVIVPHKLVDQVLWFLHGSAASGHMAAKKALQRAHQLCYWPFMSRDIHAWCEKLEELQYQDHKHLYKPFQKVAADILELPITSCNNCYVLVVQDYFTKYVNLFALPDQRTMTVAKYLFENYIREHGIPESLHTDQGCQFESDVVKHLCQLLGIRKTRTNPYHPQSDGMVERFNRTLIDQLSKTLLEHSGEWDDYLNQVALAYNTSTHSSTGFTPFFLTHGRDARLSADVMFRCMSEVPRSTPGTPADYAAMLVKKVWSAFTTAALNTHQARLQQKEAYDRHVNHHPYEKGDLVWLHDPTTTRMKLTPHWKGPFEILDCLGATGDETEPEAKAQVVHYNRLR
uniref:Gypsy retrotransposon integrase-like protein 1 n=1 Tax=Latimeria chalumnae TaxID=7897 RepID=H3B522_LATCH